MTSGDAPLLALACLFSASGFAASNALQHRVAGTVPTNVAHHAIGVLSQVVRRPLWLLASTISFAALLLHATALSLGPIALVQPLMLVGVVIAVPMRAALDLTTPTWRELRAVLITVAGLVMFMWGVNPGTATTTRPSPVPAALMVIGGLGAAVVALATSPAPHRATAPPSRDPGRDLGGDVRPDCGAAQAHRDNRLLRAPRNGRRSARSPHRCRRPRSRDEPAGLPDRPLPVSMPLLNVLDVLVAVTFGVLVFHEAPGHGPTALAVQSIALGCLAVGLREVARLGPRFAPSEPSTSPARCSS